MDPAWPPQSPARRGYGIGVVLAASMVAAVIAAAGTVALVLPPSARPATAGFQTFEPTATATAAGSGGAPRSPGASARPTGAPAPSPGASAGRGTSGVGPTGPSGASGAAGSSGSPVTVSEPNSRIIAVAARVSPAVVTITSGSGGSAFDPSSGGVGVGSGFVFDASGWILTNDHVVEGADSVVVTFKSGRELPARVVATDATADLAVLRVDATDLPTVELGSSKELQVGQLLIAIGSPLATYSDSVTSGILSATGRSVNVADFQTRQRRRMTNLLQTDAAINPGNSGGPLLDGAGRVIGINTAVDSSQEGIGFAIPIDDVRAIVDRARRAG